MFDEDVILIAAEGKARVRLIDAQSYLTKACRIHTDGLNLNVCFIKAYVVDEWASVRSYLLVNMACLHA